MQEDNDNELFPCLPTKKQLFLSMLQSLFCFYLSQQTQYKKGG